MLACALTALAALACSVLPDIAIVAHRGGMDSGLPENTLPAFRSAARAGADVIELDLRATRDGNVVVLHDARVDRTTNGHGLVHELGADALRRLDTGSGVGIPTLREVFAEVGAFDVHLLLDLKPAPGLDLQAVVAETARHHRLERTIFGVRSLEDHSRLAGLQQGLRFLAFVPAWQAIDGFLEAGVEIVRVWPRWLARDPQLVERIHAAGARVWVTAGDASIDELKALAAMGVDGVLTDRPAEAVAELTCR